MTDVRSPNVPVLAFNGVEIHDRNEMLCLTDMWRAQGSDPAQRTSKWFELPTTRRFLEHVALVLNVRESDLLKSAPGRGGATYAHWQVAMAYAKYLSDDFHMWCNTVVRERMEGKVATPQIVLDPEQRAVIGGIVKAVLHAQLAQIVPALVAAEYGNLTNVWVRDNLTAGQVLDLEKVPTKGRRGLVLRTASALRKYCERNDIVPREATLGNSARAYVYPLELVHRWLKDEGRVMIREWQPTSESQGVLPFKKKGGESASGYRDH